MKSYRVRAEIQQFARAGLRCSLQSEACNALGASDEVIQSAGGDPAVCLARFSNTGACCNHDTRLSMILNVDKC